METIDDSNYELWLMRYVDGDLTADEHEAVEQWLEGHPAAAEELAFYREAPRLECDERVHYAATTRPQPRPLWTGGWRWAAAAAVVLLLLTPAAIHLFADTDEPMTVAQTTPPAPVADTVSVAPQEPRPMAKPAMREPADAPVETQAPMDVFENFVPSRPAISEPALLAEAEPEAVPLPADTVMAAQPAFVQEITSVEEDTLDYLEQRLLALADGTREGLQGTYLGRRLARRLPENDELLTRVDEARERTPRGIRVVTDLVVKLIEVNSKENNQQNSISL